MNNSLPPSRQARRMRAALIDAFRSLLKQKPYNAITISEVADFAMVGRSTFYRYFEDKQALLVAMHADVYRSWRFVPTTRRAWLSDTPSEGLKKLFARATAYDDTPALLNMMGKDVGILLRQIENLMSEQVEAGLDAAFPEVDKNPFLAAQIAGVLNGAMKWWYFEKPDISTEIAATQLQRTLRAIVQEALLEQ